jgi:cell division protease FtsH
MGVGGDMNAATAMITQALAFYAMGDTIASRSVTLAGMRGAQSLETGSDRAMFDSQFGKGVESKLEDLYQATWQLLDDNRAEILAIAHALETEKTITGDDVAAIIDGTPGPAIDGRPYHDPGFSQMLERYHEAVLRAHKQHAGVEARIPVPVPPPPVDLSLTAQPEMPGNGHVTRPRIGIDPHSPPRPDGA